MIIKRVKNIFFGNSWLTTFSSVFFINCIQLIQTKYFAVNFDKHSIGMFSIFLATVSIVQLIGESGISTAVIRREKLDAVFINNAIALNSVFFVLIWIVSLFSFEIIKGYLKITTNLLFFNLIFLLSYFQYLYGLLYAIAINQDLVNGIGKIELISKVVGFCSVLFFVNYFSHLNTIFLVFTIPLILQIIMIAKIINKKIKFKLTKIDLIPFFIQNKGFIIFLTMDRVFNSIASWLDNYIIGYKFGASNLANYSLLRQISQKPSAILSSVFNRVMYAEMIKVRYDKFLLTTIYLKNIRIIVVLNMLFVLLFYCFSEQIIIILLSNQYLQYQNLLWGLIYYFTLRSALSPAGILFTLNAENRRSFLWTIIYSSFLILSVLIASFQNNLTYFPLFLVLSNVICIILSYKYLCIKYLETTFKNYLINIFDSALVTIILILIIHFICPNSVFSKLLALGVFMYLFRKTIYNFYIEIKSSSPKLVA